MSAPFRRFSSKGRRAKKDSENADNTFWALRDVSFEVKRGEVVGIIGRNGAGKSTLLKILSRITKPTSGEARISGRVGSLLEVGTGFHPELTGRENIYLNGAILGMKRTRFKPSSTTSSPRRGTKIRGHQSSATAAACTCVCLRRRRALEPEILPLPKVLAGGDASSRRNVWKDAGVGERGRAVFFVSHNMSAITRLCHGRFC